VLSCCLEVEIEVSPYNGGDLTLDIQFEFAVEFNYQGPGVHISGVRG